MISNIRFIVIVLQYSRKTLDLDMVPASWKNRKDERQSSWRHGLWELFGIANDVGFGVLLAWGRISSTGISNCKQIINQH